MMKVLVIIVTYNGMKWIKKCLDSVKFSSIPAQMYIVDNGSTDGTQTFITENYPSAIFVQSTKNLGFGCANNLGLRYSIKHNYEFVYLLNQDAWILSDTLEKMIVVSRKYPMYAVLSPMQMQGNMKCLDSNFIEYACYHDKDRKLFSDLYFQMCKDVYDVDFVMAAHWLIPVAVLHKVGIFSPTFHHYGEDNNFIHRAQYHGYKIGIIVDAKAVHDRENRMMTLQKSIYLSYVYVLSLLSNPLINNKLYSNFFFFVKMSLKNHSLLPLKYFSDLLMKYSIIKKNRDISMNIEGAFI